MITESTKLADTEKGQKSKLRAFKQQMAGIYGVEEGTTERSTRAYMTRESCGVQKPSIPVYSITDIVS